MQKFGGKKCQILFAIGLGGGGAEGGGVVKMSNHEDFVKPLVAFDHMKPTC